MESPVVLDKPPEYGNTNSGRGFPFDEEDESGAWSQLAARHPDIAARLRARPQTWQRKRRPSGHDADDFADDFSGFDRFPFDDIPPEFREHFPQHFTRREQPPPPPPPVPPQQHTSSTQTSSTQTEQPSASNLDPQANLPQYGLRNTVDLGQKSPVDPSVDAEDRSQRSASAPPESRNAPNMSQPPHSEPHQPAESHSNVRHIPIFVEGRDEPVINKTDHGAHYAEPKPAYAPPPHVDREQYFSDDIPVGFNHPQNFSRAFGTPFHKGFRQGPQPFVQQKVYPQTAFARANSPHRSQSPKPQHHQEEFVKVPVHHENKPEPPRTAPKPAQHPKAPQQQQQQQEQQQQPPQPQQAPPKPTPSPNDPITQILAVQTDVLNLMTEVENFTGSKKDKRYMFLDEMLTRNLIKLDTIETDGKENIRQARKEAIKCIQKCIAVLEAKAEKGSQALEAEMKENQSGAAKETEAAPANEDESATANENQAATDKVEIGEETKEEKQEPKPEVEQPLQPQEEAEKKEEQTPQAADTRPEEPKEADGDKKASLKKKVVKKRGKSKENQPALPENNTEAMQVDDKGDKSAPNSQTMDVDGAAASQ